MVPTLHPEWYLHLCCSLISTHIARPVVLFKWLTMLSLVTIAPDQSAPNQIATLFQHVLLCSLTHDSDTNLLYRSNSAKRSKERRSRLRRGRHTANIAASQPMHLLDIASITASRSALARHCRHRSQPVGCLAFAAGPPGSLTCVDCRCRVRERLLVVHLAKKRAHLAKQ